MQSNDRGFTLLELLVVLAVVGLMSSLLLVYVKSVKNQATDNLVRSNLLSVRSQSAIYFDEVGNYDDFLTTPNTIQMKAVDAAGRASGGGWASGDGPLGWYARVQLKSKPGFSWCVDYLGNSKEVVTDATNPDDALACP